MQLIFNKVVTFRPAGVIANETKFSLICAVACYRTAQVTDRKLDTDIQKSESFMLPNFVFNLLSQDKAIRDSVHATLVP